jgi:hypothetical protein
MVQVKEDADQATAPAGVLLPQGKGLVPQGGAGLGAAAPAGAVGRGQGLVAFPGAALEQMADGTQWQAEVAGDSRSRLPALGLWADDLTQG